jgi:hypothetical protein
MAFTATLWSICVVGSALLSVVFWLADVAVGLAVVLGRAEAVGATELAPCAVVFGWGEGVTAGLVIVGVGLTEQPLAIKTNSNSATKTRFILTISYVLSVLIECAKIGLLYLTVFSILVFGKQISLLNPQQFDYLLQMVSIKRRLMVPPDYPKAAVRNGFIEKITPGNLPAGQLCPAHLPFLCVGSDHLVL